GASSPPPAAAPATLRRLGYVLGLVDQGLVDHAPRDGPADLHGQLLELRELRTPGHAFRPVDLLGEVFRDPMDEIRLIVDRDRRVGLASHPSVPPCVATPRWTRPLSPT